MIYSSLTLLRFILVRLFRVGLYQQTATFQGSTSDAFPKAKTLLGDKAYDGD